MTTATRKQRSSIDWLDALEPAFEQARKSGKLVLLDAYNPG